MKYEIGSLLSADNQWALVIGHINEDIYNIYFLFRGEQQYTHADNVRPIGSKYDLTKTYFAGMHRTASLKFPDLVVKWVQKQLGENHE